MVPDHLLPEPLDQVDVPDPKLDDPSLLHARILGNPLPLVAHRATTGRGVRAGWGSPPLQDAGTPQGALPARLIGSRPALAQGWRRAVKGADSTSTHRTEGIMRSRR